MPAHPYRTWLGPALAAFLLMGGCQAPEKAAPRKLEGQGKGAARGSVETPKKDGEAGFRNPDLEPPPGREGDQLPAEELSAVVAKAEKLLAEDDHRTAHRELRACANKIPANARCDLLMAQALERRGRRRAESRYYYAEVAKNDDPATTAATYATAGEALRKVGAYNTAVMALKKALEREDTAELHVALSRVMQSMPDKLEDAAMELGIAYEMAPDELDYLHEQATVLAQTGKWSEAADLFEGYLEKTKGEDKARDKRVQDRIDELRRWAKLPDDQAVKDGPMPMKPKPAPLVDGGDAEGGEGDAKNKPG